MSSATHRMLVLGVFFAVQACAASVGVHREELEWCTCGNAVCQPTCGETSNDCPSDCRACICGNALCQAGCGESAGNCPGDCATCGCGNSVCDRMERNSVQNRAWWVETLNN